MCQWNNLGPLSVISEEKLALQGTTYGGRSSRGGPLTFSPEPPGDPPYGDQANYDHTVIKNFKLPSKEASQNDSGGNSASHSPLSQKVMKPTIADNTPPAGDNSTTTLPPQFQTSNVQKSRATRIVRKRQVMKERMTGRCQGATEITQQAQERDLGPSIEKVSKDMLTNDEPPRQAKENPTR